MATAQSSSSKKRRDGQRFTDVSKEPDKLLPPLPPIVQLHSGDSSSLYEAIKPLQPLVEDLPDRVTYSLKRCKTPKDGLTNDESAAIFLYTLQWPEGKTSFYTIFNRTLRDENRAKLVPFHKYLNLFMSAFNKLPSIQDRVWRGETGDWGAHYKRGTIHVWWGVSSCTEMVQVTGDFLDDIKKRTLFNIKCMNGKIIKNHSKFPDESETILPPSTYLKVKSSLPLTPDVLIVDLEEIIPTSEELAQLAAAVAPSGTISSMSQIDDIHIVWLDPDVNKSKENKKTQEKLKKLFSNSFKSFEKSEEAVNYVRDKQNQHILLITGGQIGRQIVSKINDLSQLKFIIIYCMNKEANEQWSKDYEKVKAVVVQADEMIENLQVLYKQLTELGEEMQPLYGVMDQPLLSLEESLQGFTHIIPKLEVYIRCALKNSESPAEGLLQSESAAIHIYTMEWEPSESCLHRLLNQDFRTGTQNALKKWFPYLKLFLHALNKLPSFQGTVYRGITVDITSQFVVGQTGTWRGVTSTVANMSVLQHSCYLGTDGARILFPIECKNGKCIQSHSYYPNEHEILLLPGFYFEVTSKLNAGNGLHLISLKQILSSSEETAIAAASDVYTSTQQFDNIDILWFDPDVNKSKENKKTQEKLKELFHISFKPFENLEEAVIYIRDKQNQCFLLITGGQAGRQIVPKINALSQLKSIIIYCMNKPANEQWSKDYEKVKTVVIEADEMISKVQKLYKDLEEQQMKLPKKYVKSGILRFTDDKDGPMRKLGLLHGIKDQPFVSLEISLEAIIRVVPYLRECINEAMKNCQNPPDGLTQNESAAIHIYTMRLQPEENSIYCMLNHDLRSESRNSTKKWFPYLKLFLQALNKLPSYRGTVWRGMRADVRSHFRVEETGIWWGVSSSTITMSTLESSNLMGQYGKRTLFSIECTNGKCIEKHSYFPMEGEILLLPGFSYEVTSNLDAGNELYIIGLKETVPSYDPY